MVNYQHKELKNGLQLYFIEDKTTQMATLNLLYQVGSRDEDENLTGFAHLFEHLMFGGSLHVPAYDEEVQKVGGENNAFTSPDITNYYITLPAQNLETAFWLESDRMLSLSFDEKVLEVQRKVVIEEFKQRYLNQPYGDAWLKLRPLAYQKHPYQWATIGKDISHIANATMQEVKDFFFRYYVPNNAILTVAGNCSWQQVQNWAEKWFEPIAHKPLAKKALPQEPPQTTERVAYVQADVPLEAIYKAFHIVKRTDELYYAVDLLSDILGGGKSSRLYQKLVKDEPIFNSINCYVTGSVDEGLLVIQGKLNENYTLFQGNEAIQKVITDLQNEVISQQELEKVKNQVEASLVFSEVDILHRAMNLAYFAMLGNPDRINQEAQKIQAVTPKDIQMVAQRFLKPENSANLFYQKNK